MHTVVASCSRACIIINSRQHSTAHSLLYITPLPPPLTPSSPESPPPLGIAYVRVPRGNTRSFSLFSFSLILSLSFSFKSGVIKCLPYLQTAASTILALFFASSLLLLHPLPCLGISLIASCETKLVSLSFSLSRLLQIDESIDSTGGVVVLGTKRKKGSLNEYSQPEGEEEKGTETEMANERMNRDDDDDDDDGKHTKNTYLPYLTLKKRTERKERRK